MIQFFKEKTNYRIYTLQELLFCTIIVKYFSLAR